MNIQVVSDIHAEFHFDQGGTFITETLKNESVDVLIIAGDLAPIQSYHFLVPLLVKQYPYVVLVLGNHEYYYHTKDEVNHTLNEICKEYPTFHILENDSVTINDQRFVGCTLWFSDIPAARKYQFRLNDFKYIKGFKSWVFDRNLESINYLKSTVKNTDIVITHHIPTEEAVNPRWKNDILQSFFVCDMEGVLINNCPKIWVFGHTHDSYDGVMHKTRLLCNPYGYQGTCVNPDFDDYLVVSA